MSVFLLPLKRHSRLPALLLSCVLAMLLGGCMNPQTPEQVSQQFWQAVQQQDNDDIVELSTLTKANQIRFQRSNWQSAEITFGKIIIDGDKAAVETRLQQPDKEQPRTFTTHLLKQQDDWVVDFDATRTSLEQRSSLGSLIDNINQLGKSLGDSFNRSQQDWSEQMDELADKLDNLSRDAQQQADEVIEQYSEELQQQLQDLEESIDEALKDNSGTNQQAPSI